MMNVVYNKYIPFKGFKAITLYPFGVFSRVRDPKNITYRETMKTKDIAHEAIHLEQQKEMLIIVFYLWYIIEWIIRLFLPGNAYENISFEREAYSNENNQEYLSTRKRYAWVKYLFNSNKKEK